jgi:type II secretory pathway pseudopilin PulG
MKKLRQLWGRPINRGIAPGFTILELLIAVLLAALITSAAMALYLTQQKQFLVQSDVTDMQSSLRAAAMELTSRLRMAGYNLPEGFPCIVAHNTDPDTIEVITNSNLLDGVRIEHSMPQPSSELRCDGHDISGLNIGDTIYIFDPYAMRGEFFEVSQVQLASSNIQHNDWPLSQRYPAGSQVIKTVSYKYYIDMSNRDHPSLAYRVSGQAPQIYADNITSLDFKYVLSSGEIVDTTSAAYMIREAIISLGARTDKADNDFLKPYRSRTLTTRIKIRNLGDN